jgi:hypothetical protein
MMSRQKESLAQLMSTNQWRSIMGHRLKGCVDGVFEERWCITIKYAWRDLSKQRFL